MIATHVGIRSPILEETARQQSSRASSPCTRVLFSVRASSVSPESGQRSRKSILKILNSTLKITSVSLS